MILSLILSLIGPGNRNKEGQGGGFPSSLFVPNALFILCQMPSHQICNEHPVAVCANTSTWIKEGEGSTSLVDDTDQPSVQANPAVRESWPQQVPSLCRHGHLHRRCPSSNRLPDVSSLLLVFQLFNSLPATRTMGVSDVR